MFQSGGSTSSAFRMDGGAVSAPYYESVGLDYPDLSCLAKEMGMQDGDAAVVCGADNIQTASSSAFGAVIRLLGSGRGTASETQRFINDWTYGNPG